MTIYFASVKLDQLNKEPFKIQIKKRGVVKMLEMPFCEHALHYDSAQDKGEALKKFLQVWPNAPEILKAADGNFSFPVSEIVPTGTIINFFDIPRQSQKDGVGEISFIVVDPPRVDYTHQQGSNMIMMAQWWARLELYSTDLTPGDIKSFLDNMFAMQNGFTKDDLREGLRTYGDNHDEE